MPPEHRVSSDREARLVRFSDGSEGPPKEFLRYRARQLELVLDLARVPLRGQMVLELGGGVSGQSFLMAEWAASVVCTDLLRTEGLHSTPFERAAALQRLSPTANLFFVCGRGEQIPLRSSSMDVVFSSYVFEHIADRAAAAREVARVLRPGGVAITVVPNVPETVLRALWFASFYAPRQLVKMALLRSGLARRLRVRIAHPPSLRHTVHGAYSGHREELLGSRSGVWDSLFEDAGLRVTRRFTASFEGYLGFVSQGLTMTLQSLLAPLTRRVGGVQAARSIGLSYCFVAEKPV